MTQEILIASDHAGFALKESLLRTLKAAFSKIKFTDLGPSNDSSVDYPNFANDLCVKMKGKESVLGILICGSGIGMAIAANRHSHIRAAVVENPIAASLARMHNHANVLCLGSRFVAPEYAFEIIRAWLEASPSQEERHLKRVKKLGA